MSFFPRSFSVRVLLWFEWNASCFLFFQRDSIQAISSFSIRNHLPMRLRNQMMDHLRLKYRTESLQQEKTMAKLPKRIRSNVAQHLFLPVIEKVYLFQGTSYDFLLQLVYHLSILLRTFPKLFVLSKE